jgi:hypothetical protein
MWKLLPSYHVYGISKTVRAELKFFEEPPYCFPEWLYQFTFPPAVYESFFFPTSSPTFVVVFVFYGNHSNKIEVES